MKNDNQKVEEVGSQDRRFVELVLAARKEWLLEMGREDREG